MIIEKIVRTQIFQLSGWGVENVEVLMTDGRKALSYCNGLDSYFYPKISRLISVRS